MIKSTALHVARGFAMGAADIVPGVSGGTIALLLGIYERLLRAIGTAAGALGRLLRGDLSGAVRRIRTVDWAFLIPLVAGILLAVAALSSLLDRLLMDYPEEMAGLFFGLVLASVVIAWGLLKHRDGPRLIVMAGVAIAAFFLLGLQSGPVASPSLLAFFGAGAVAICAMILPGISGSFLLLMLGMYAGVLNAVNDREITNLLVFAIGLIIGIALFSSGLNWLLARAHDTVLAALIGLMAGSLRVLWPWPNGVGIISDETETVVDGTGLDWPAGDEIAVPVLLALGAFAIVVGLGHTSATRPLVKS